MQDSTFSAQQLARFHDDGYLIVRALLKSPELARLREQTLAALAHDPAPLELETEVGYPGAPATADEPGGATPRRLLRAFARGGALRDWARNPRLLTRLAQLFDSPELMLCQAHHNCVMTKHPRHSSDTGWHQDLRYWSFSGSDLINTWLALSPEYPKNGGLYLIPGSHRWQVATDRLDEASFLRPRHPRNAAPIAAANAVELAPGDVLFFHAGVFHSASRNHTADLKLSVVYTYHPSGIVPRAGTKSAAWPAVPMSGGSVGPETVAAAHRK